LIKDSTPPKLSAKENILVLDNTLVAAATLSSFNTKLIMPPNPRICFLAISWL
jgi:hypothetical protein